MPGIDGLKTIHAIRHKAPHIPIIAVSGAMPAIAVGYALDGLTIASNFTAVTSLRKPFRPEELRQAARMLIAGRRYDAKSA
jgi:CheY-like chemotaxis protein